MRAEILLNGSASATARYVGWAPVSAQVRLTGDTGGAGAPVTVTLRNRTATGGQVEFYAAVPGDAQPELTVALPAAGGPVEVFVAGRWQRPSTQDGDAAVEIVEAGTDRVLGSLPLMVRVRKNATTLTTAERDRFCNALAVLNNRGMGPFSDFRSVHNNDGDLEAHGRAGFLPWHRAFLLDLERELQRIDPSVALPYWRFDRPAARLFSRGFLGVTNQSTGAVQFGAANPLQFWATDGIPGIVRRPLFNTQRGAASSPAYGAVLTETATVALGTPRHEYFRFRAMEDDPHGTAHVSFTGFVSAIQTAAKDPLFFLLHANVDRLWAKWQWSKRRFDETDAGTFSTMGDLPERVGHRLDDTMWPWNGVTTRPRPATAPGGPMPPSPLTDAPGPRPRVRNMIDYQGVHTPANRLGFDYDDVPFEFGMA